MPESEVLSDGDRAAVKEAQEMSLEIQTLLQGRRLNVIGFALSEVVAAMLTAWPEDNRLDRLKAFSKAVAMQLILFEMSEADTDKPVVN